jgi:ribosomal protein RSM22 (predicted rRNA methylase)
MALPEQLGQAIEAALGNTAPGLLETATASLSQRYRAETRDGRQHVSDELAAKAYIAARLPATFAAVQASLENAYGMRPDFAPQSLLDIGAGPGTVLFAVQDLWPGLANAVLVEASSAMRGIGAVLVPDITDIPVEWVAADATRLPSGLKPADIVTLSYVLNELSVPERHQLVHRLWDLTGDMLVIVEPGTPAGFERIRHHRRQLLDLGANILAPCTHSCDCPIIDPDWCHFSKRLSRSRLHKSAKNAVMAYEDEKYAFLAVSRTSVTVALHPRVLSQPHHGSGKTSLKLCQPDGTVAERLVTRREGAVYKQARKLEWGDVLFADE